MSSEFISFEKMEAGHHQDGIWFSFDTELPEGWAQVVLTHGQALDLAYAILNAVSDDIGRHKPAGG